eukprot:TRINITY_DN29341_c0_g1_i5.p2 TRINITY_DN29341_c0_g1~~TRINITY_DN29341_c0_g1_i5.p2  ORF type:complete len:149 (-),score=45.91 TRINITY_DN29341_c0_g1_i5:3-449(-)
MQRGLVGSEMCIRDRYQRRVHGIHQAEGMKAQIKTLMEEVVAKITKKEKEFESLIDSLLDDSIKSVESFRIQIKDKAESISQIISQMSQNMEGDLHSALVYFAENIRSLQATVEEEVIPREKYEYLIENTGVPISNSSILQFLSLIHI